MRGEVDAARLPPAPRLLPSSVWAHGAGRTTSAPRRAPPTPTAPRRCRGMALHEPRTPPHDFVTAHASTRPLRARSIRPRWYQGRVLHELRVENLLLIERAELRLRPGLNVLTGETGAGKTVLAGALDLLL